MPHSFGYKARTRDMFARAFKKQGHHELSKYFIQYKVGDIVDIKGDGSVQKGMPHKFYHGRTGIVFNVTKSGLGVEVNKLVNGRILKKRICIRLEHCRPSRSREDFLRRVKSNETLKREAKKTGVAVAQNKISREPVQPKAGMIVKASRTVQTVEPLPYEFMV